MGEVLTRELGTCIEIDILVPSVHPVEGVELIACEWVEDRLLLVEQCIECLSSANSPSGNLKSAGNKACAGALESIGCGASGAAKTGVGGGASVAAIGVSKLVSTGSSYRVHSASIRHGPNVAF